MVRFVDIICELYDLNSKYDWSFVGGKDSKYTFTTNKGTEYEVSFKPYLSSPGKYERDYKPKKSTHNVMTGEGNPLSIGATVMDITNDFLNKTKDFKELSISPITSKRFTVVQNFLDKNLDSKFFPDYNYEEGTISIYRKAR